MFRSAVVLCLAAVVLSLFSPVAPAETAGTDSVVYRNQPLGFSLPLPRQWTGEVKKGADYQALIFSGPKGTEAWRTTLNIQIVTKKSGMSLAGQADSLIAQWQRAARFKLLGRQTGRMSGRPGLRLEVTYADPGGSGTVYHQEQYIVDRGEDFFYLAYTAPQRLYKAYRPRLTEALAGLKFFAPQPAQARTTPAAQPGPPNLPSSPVLVEAALHRLAGPLYSPSYDNGTPRGKKLVALHSGLVADLHRLLLKLSQAQSDTLKLFGQLTLTATDQAALLSRRIDLGDPAAQSLWPEEQRLIKEALRLLQAQAAMRGAARGWLESLGRPEATGSDLGQVEILVRFQSALTDQQALILDQFDRTIVPLMVYHRRLAQPGSGLSDDIQAQLDKLNREQFKTTRLAADGVAKTNELARRLGRMLGLIGRFQADAARGYALEMAAAGPDIKATVKSYGGRGQSPELRDLLSASLANLTDMSRALIPNQPTGRLNLFDWLVPPAQAGWWDTAKTAAGKAWDGTAAVASTAGKIVAAPIRSGAGIVEYGSTRLAQELSTNAYSPFRVTTSGAEISDDPLVAQKHDIQNAKGYTELKKKVYDQAVNDYLTGRWGNRALTNAAKDISSGDEAVQQAVLGETDPEQAKNRSWLGAAGAFAVSTAYGVVMDIPKSVAILANPDSSSADKLKATYDLAATAGASVLGMSAVAKKAGQVMTKGASRVNTRLVKFLAGNPKIVYLEKKAVTETLEVTGQVAVKAEGKLAKAAVKTVTTAAKNTKGAATAITKVPVMQTWGQAVKADVAGICKEVAGNLTKGTPTEILKKFAEGYGKKGFLQNLGNNFFSAEMLHPVLKMMTGEDDQPAVAKPEPKPAKVKKAAKPEPKKAEAEKKQADSSARTAKRSRREAMEDLEAKAKRRQAREEAGSQGETPEDPPVIPATGTIDMVVWHPANSNSRNKITLYLTGGQVSGSYSITSPAIDKESYHQDASTFSGQFTGVLQDNVITGQWSSRGLTKAAYWGEKTKKDANGNEVKEPYRCEYTMEMTSSSDDRITLHRDGSLTAQSTTHGTNRTTYRGDCDKNSGKTITNSWTHPDDKTEAKWRRPMQGVWAVR